jgi:hypothetical protein
MFWGMQGVNPADIAAGVLIAALFIAVILWCFRASAEQARFFGVLWFIMGGLLIWWRVSCWTGFMTCQ